MRAFQKQSLSKCFTGSAGRFQTLKTVRRLAGFKLICVSSCLSTYFFPYPSTTFCLWINTKMKLVAIYTPKSRKIEALEPQIAQSKKNNTEMAEFAKTEHPIIRSWPDRWMLEWKLRSGSSDHRL